MLGFEVKHIGINTENAEEAMKAAKLFELMFGFDVSEGNSSIFCGSRALSLIHILGVSAVVSTFCTFLIGTASDRLGRRRPFIAFGYILWGCLLYTSRCV